MEREHLSRNCGCIAGIDEAGRGALAGPLAVGMVIYPERLVSGPENGIGYVDDSKRMTAKARLDAARIIRSRCTYHDVVFIQPEEIDRRNINSATELAIINLIERARVRPDLLLIDGRFKFVLPIPYLSVVRGDSLSLSIASASVLAKVARDAEMDRLDEIFPPYGFRKNKGYGTALHLDALRRFGFCPIHRKSYEPIKSMRLS